jgi:hypothetical protein
VPPGRDYSPYQRRVIRDYYRNQEGIQGQALSDLVSDLWLATTEAKKKSLWARAEKLLGSLGAPPDRVAAIVSARDVKALADVAAKGFATPRTEDWKRDAREDRSRS